MVRTVYEVGAVLVYDDDGQVVLDGEDGLVALDIGLVDDLIDALRLAGEPLARTKLGIIG